MNLQEAYTILGCDESTSDDDLRKKFKRLAKTKHPDINKETNAEMEFKKLNAAYQTIDTHRKNPQPQGFPFEVNIQDFFSNFTGGFPGGFGRVPQSKPRQVSNIQINETVSFKESVTGTERDISYQREVKCDACDGIGSIQKKNNCTHCGGTGTKQIRSGSAIFSTQCPACKGVGSEENCVSCNRASFINKEISITVQIPPGVQSGNTMQLSGAGHFIQTSLFGDNYSSVLINLTVEKDNDLTIDGDSVVYNLDLTLLEAIKGAKKSVPTIDGFKEIDVPSLSRHKEEVILPNLGLQRKGNQRVILNVSYPDDTKSIIEKLEGV